MPATTATDHCRALRVGATRWAAALGLAATLTACASGAGTGSADAAAAGAGVAALDIRGAERPLTTVAERLPYAQERRFTTCPVLAATAVEQSLDEVLTLPPRERPWTAISCRASARSTARVPAETQP
jgi:hypothetical protein